MGAALDTVVDQILKKSPDSWPASYQKAIRLIHAGRTEKAQAYARKSAELKPGWWLALTLVVKFEIAKEHKAEAEAIYAQLRKFAPVALLSLPPLENLAPAGSTTPAPRFSKGELIGIRETFIKEASENLEFAIADARRFRIETGELEFLVLEGVLLWKMGDWPGASRIFEKALANPEGWRARLGYSIALLLSLAQLAAGEDHKARASAAEAARSLAERPRFAPSSFAWPSNIRTGAARREHYLGRNWHFPTRWVRLPCGAIGSYSDCWPRSRPVPHWSRRCLANLG